MGGLRLQERGEHTHFVTVKVVDAHTRAIGERVACRTTSHDAGAESKQEFSGDDLDKEGKPTFHRAGTANSGREDPGGRSQPSRSIMGGTVVPQKAHIVSRFD